MYTTYNFSGAPWPCVPQADAWPRFVFLRNSKEEKRGKTALNERAVKTNVLRDKSAAFVLAPAVKSARLGKIMMQLGESLLAVSHPAATVGEGD